MINDAVFITFILYNKSLDQLINTSLLLLPIINSPNHSGTKRTRVVFGLNLGALFIISNLEPKPLYFVPFFLLGLLSLLKRFRYSLGTFANDLMSIIDTYNIHNYQFGHTYKIYKRIIQQINHSSYSKWCSIENIVCFILRGKELILYDSYKLIVTYKINLDEELLSAVKSGKVINNVKITIDGKDENIDYLRSIDLENHLSTDNTLQEKTLFCIFLQPNPYIFKTYLSDILLNTLTPLFIRTASLISMERELRLVRDEQILKIKNKLSYVNNAILAIHFIRNKLSPIQNSIMMTLHQNTKKNSNHTILWNNLKNRDLIQSEYSLKEILVKTDYLLESGDNPFKINSFIEISFKKFYFLIRRIWLLHFDIESIYMDVDVTFFQTSSFLVDTEAVEIVFTDIITNANKYCSEKSLCKLNIQQYDGNVKINIINTLKDKYHASAMQFIAKSYNTKEFSIINKKTHGLKIVKEFLEQMDIDYLLTVNDLILDFQLIVKNLNNERHSNL